MNKKIYDNVFKQNIIIWYLDDDWGKYIYNTIIEEYDPELIERRGADAIYLIDGSIIMFYKMTEHCARCHRCCISLIQEDAKTKKGINEFVNQFIRPITFQALYWIKEYEELLYPKHWRPVGWIEDAE